MTVHTIDVEALDWRVPGDSWAGTVGPDEPQVRYKAFDTGAAQVPRGELVHYEPGHCEAPHSHDESELFYILAGDATIGDQPIAAGMLVHIAGSTVYGPTIAGVHGMTFLRLHLGN